MILDHIFFPATFIACVIFIPYVFLLEVGVDCMPVVSKEEPVFLLKNNLQHTELNYSKGTVHSQSIFVMIRLQITFLFPNCQNAAMTICLTFTDTSIIPVSHRHTQNIHDKMSCESAYTPLEQLAALSGAAKHARWVVAVGLRRGAAAKHQN